MENIKRKISRLSKTGTQFRLGMVMSLSFVLFAFSYTDYHTPGNLVIIDDLTYPDMIVMTEIAPPVQIKVPELPPPPKIETPAPIIEVEKKIEIKKIETPKIESVVTAVNGTGKEPIKVAPINIKSEPLKEIIDEGEKALDDDEVIFMPSDMPRFPGCDEGLSKEELRQCAEARLIQFVSKNYKIPAMVRETGSGGIVVVSFIVEKDGSISNEKVLRDIGAGSGKEARRVISKFPKWIPGKQQGRPVRVKYNLPIKVRIQ